MLDFLSSSLSLFPSPSVSLGSRLRVPETGLIYTIPS